MKSIVKATKVIISTITSIAIAIGIVFVVLFALGLQPFVVESGSMEPSIPTGSVCFINTKSVYEEMKVGDIIAFKIDGSKFATHRVYEITEEGIKTKGDANPNVDSIITTRENFAGKNVFSIPRAGFIIKSIQTTRGKIIIGTLVAVLLVAGIMIGEPKKKEKSSN